jgi:hypothetical protein
MKKILIAGIALLLLSIVSTDIMYGWGFRSHRNIHAAAIQGLPEPLNRFFEHYADFIIEQSVAPDLRRNTDPTEGPYHYINFERFGDNPFHDFPLKYRKVRERYGDDTLRTYGLIIWRIESWTDSLISAMRQHDADRIKTFAADLGHYVADLHMPLHTTSNYDGQLTGQRGVHRRFETELPELFDHTYTWDISEARYIKDPLKGAFRIGKESFKLVDKVFSADLKAGEGIPKDRLFRPEEQNGRTIYIYHEDYYRRFHEFLDGMVESRLRLAAERVRDYWYTAWVKAGKPDLFWEIIGQTP